MSARAASSGPALRLGLFVASVIVLLVALGAAVVWWLAPDRPRPPQDLALAGPDATFLIEEPGDRPCGLSDHRSQLMAMSASDGELRWVVDIPWAEPPQLLVNEERALVWTSEVPNGYSSVLAVSLPDGRPLWQTEIEGSPTSDTEAHLLGSVVLVVDDGDVLALDQATGAEIWRRPVGTRPAHALVGELVIATALDASAAVAVDGRTGELRWEHPTPGEGGPSAPVVVGDVVIVHERRGDLVGLDVSSGREVWRSPAPTLRYWEPVIGAADGVAVVRHSPVLTGPEAEELPVRTVGMDPRSGATLWDYPDDQHPPLLAGDLLIAVGLQHLDARSVASGTQLWRHDARVSVVHRPSADLVLVDVSASEPTLLALNATDGTLRWRRNLDVGGLLPSSDPNDALLIGGGHSDSYQPDDADQNGYIVAVDPKTGSQQWRTNTRDPVRAPPVRVGDAIIALSTDVPVSCD